MAMAQIQDLIAKTALEHYFTNLPRKGKPSETEWTVYAAIVATFRNTDTNNADVRVISSATGSKCTAVNDSCPIFSKFQVPACCRVKDLRSAITSKSCHCLCQEQIKSLILRDSHAEILARRGLLRVLWNELQNEPIGIINNSEGTFSKNNFKLLERVDGENLQFRLRQGVSLHLYISDSPCGDASIYNIDPKYHSNSNMSNFTGAKIYVDDNIGSSKTSNLILSRETTQRISALRLKSGRSDIPSHLRSTSMSCSDKICKWIILGMQGSGLLSSLIKSPIYLSSIVVSLDERSDEVSQLNALKRALTDRAKTVHEQLTQSKTVHFHYPELFIVSAQFPRGKSAVEKQSFDMKLDTLHEVKGHFPNKKQKLVDGSSTSCIAPNGKPHSPIGMSSNWQCETKMLLNCTSSKPERNQIQNVELVVGAKGIKQYKKSKSASDIIKCTSRLSSWSLFQLGLECMERLLNNADDSTACLTSETLVDFIHDCKSGKISYQEVKCRMGNPSIRAMKSDIFRSGPLSGWVCDTRDFHLYLNNA